MPLIERTDIALALALGLPAPTSVEALAVAADTVAASARSSYLGVALGLGPEIASHLAFVSTHVATSIKLRGSARLVCNLDIGRALIFALTLSAQKRTDIHGCAVV